MRIPQSVRAFALKHRINLGRDEHGNYFVRDPATGKVAARYMTATPQPTAANALAIMRRWLRDRKNGGGGPLLDNPARLDRPELARAAELFAQSVAAARRHNELAAQALKKYGEHGPAISGAVRSHFPAKVKDELRALARDVSRLSDEAYKARPRGVRVSTMRELARDVATRDGSGFYGAQARNPRRRRRATASRRRRGSTVPRQSSGNAARARARYRATYRNGKRLEFQATSDARAIQYARGLGAHKARSVPKSVLRLDEPPGRKGNPSQRDELEQAARAFEDFTGAEATRVERFEGGSHKAGWLLGRLAAVSYIATRDGEPAEYVHRFKRRSRPQLVASFDGSQLYVLGGAYSVTDRGIEDR